MNALGRRLLTFVVAVGFLPAGAWFASAQQNEPPQAQGGKMYPVGTVLSGECKYTNKVEIASQYQHWYHGAWSNADFLPSDQQTCTQKLTEAGLWRMRVFKPVPYGGETIKIVGPFVVSGRQCAGDQAKVVRVTTPNGGTSGLEGLQGEHLFEYGMLTTEADVSLDFADGSRVNITKGSSFGLDGCQQYRSPELPAMMKFSLFLGRVWSKIAGPGRIEVRTERVVAGNRGTIFSIAYDDNQKLTTVQVEEGAVWMRKISGGNTVVVNAGQTGIQRGDDQPVVQRSAAGVK